MRADNFLIDEEEATPEPQSVIVFDDVIAGGSHFKAIKMVLRERFPGVDVVGIFLARTLRPEEPTVEIDLGPLLGDSSESGKSSYSSPPCWRVASP